MEVTWKLKPNLKWHDGAPLTADDFAFGIQVAKDPQLALTHTGGVNLVKDVTAPDANTLVVRWSDTYYGANEGSPSEMPALPRRLLGDLYQQGDPNLFTNSTFWTTAESRTWTAWSSVLPRPSTAKMRSITLPFIEVPSLNAFSTSSQARKRTADAGLAAQVRFEVASAQTFDGGPYDLVTTFDSLHDMGDPLGAARHIREMLAPDGTWMVVEPFAGNSVTDNLNPVGRVYYSFSTFLCVPSALSQDGGYSLGAQAGEEPIRRLAGDAGFTGFRRVAETPFNIVYEVRP